MSQQPARCPRTTYELGLTWLAGGGPRPPRRAYLIHGGGGSTRPTRHGISSSTKGTKCRQWRSPHALEDSPAARWLVPFVGSSQRAPWVVVPFVDNEIPCLVGRIEPPPP